MCCVAFYFGRPGLVYAVACPETCRGIRVETALANFREQSQSRALRHKHVDLREELRQRQTNMIETNCASCGKQLDYGAPKCVRCKSIYLEF